MQLHKNNLLILFITLFSFNYLLADCQDLPSNDNTLYIDSNGVVWYNFTQNVSGFQFNVEGATISGASGGAAGDAGFTVSAGGTTVLGFSFTGAQVPAGSGILTTLSLSGTPTGLSGIVLSNSSSQEITGSTSTSLCDQSSCNWYDCAGVCEGTAVVDCAGTCGGTAVEDACGVCGGDGSSCSSSLDCSALPTNINGFWIDTSGVVYYNFLETVAGFQFNVEGATISGASGGAAQAAGFTVSAGGTTVLGFSFTGATIAAGSGTLTTLTLSGIPTGLSGIVMSDSAAGNITVQSTTNICGDDGGDGGGDTCASGVYDCAGVCDGTAVVDCAGTCGGTAVQDDCGVCGGDGSSCGGTNVTDGCDLPNSTVFLLSNGDVIYNVSTDIAGFQFDVSGATVIGASGGAAQAAGFTVSAGNTTVLAFSFTGATISDDCGLLTTLSLSGEATGLHALSFADSNAGTIDVDYYCSGFYDCVGVCNGQAVEDCTGVCGGPALVDCAGVCNGQAVVDCAGTCGGWAVIDECGVCDGYNSSCSDCAGTPNGDAVVDECGVCDGDNSSCAGCDGVPNSGLELDECGLCGGDGSSCIIYCSALPTDVNGMWIDASGVVYYNFLDNVAGFQFTVVGATVFGASGGDAQDAGFTVSAGGTTVLGFSFTGAQVAAGSGALTTLTLSGTPTGLSGIVMSDSTVNELVADESTSVCSLCTGSYDLCGVCDGDNTSCLDCEGIPNGSAYVDNCGTCDNDFTNDCVQDCTGIWGGTAIIDECGVCNGDNTSCVDCEGTPNGSAYIDQCNNCVTEADSSCVQDCLGVWGGQAVEDECGICDGPGSIYECGCYNPDTGYNCDGEVVDCAGYTYVPIVDNLGYAQVSESNNCYQFRLISNAYNSFDSYDISESEYINLDIENLMSGIFEISGINNTGSFATIRVLKQLYDNDSDCNLETFNTLVNQTNISISHILNFNDACGECNGLGVLEACDCEDTSGLNSYGCCDSVIADCAGVCNGNAYVDECGTCNTNVNDDCIQDECGVWGGTGYPDMCGTCDSDPNNDCIQDCNGVWGGDAMIDACDFCSGGDTGLIFNEFTDDCGVCFGDNSSCTDCEGVVNGTAVVDCAGVCGGTSDYDECGVCDGDNSSCTDCTGVVNGDSVVDVCGVCNGENACELSNLFISYGDGTSVELTVESDLQYDDYYNYFYKTYDAIITFSDGNIITMEAGPENIGYDCNGYRPHGTNTFNFDGDGNIYGNIWDEDCNYFYFGAYYPSLETEELFYNGGTLDFSNGYYEYANDNYYYWESVSNSTFTFNLASDDCFVVGPDADCAGVCNGLAELDSDDNCCDSGNIDQCGICDGDGTSCSGDGGEGGIPIDWDSDGDGYFDYINNYQNSGSVTSRVFLDGVDAGSEGDALAAFIDGEQRGYVNPSSIPDQLGGGYAFLLLVYSNEASGETITYQFYDYETDTIYEIDETTDFVSDMVLGNLINPEILNVKLTVDISKEIPIGWNWISLNVFNDNMSLDSTFVSLGNSAEFIKNQSLYADYYDDFGWFGSLTEVDNVSMYKLKTTENATFSLSGYPSEVSEVLFDLNAGFNWIGYTPQLSWDLNTALLNIPDGNAQFIKSQSLYADYYDGFGWFGTLEFMNPLLGYIISLSEDTQFNYNEGDLARISSSVMNFSTHKFDLNIHDYEYNATITSSVYVNDNRINHYDYTLVAFDGTSCVGFADGLYFPLDGNIIFPLMVYGNTEGRNLTFKLFDNTSSDYIPLKEEITFVPDMKLGDGFNPVEFHNLENPDNYVISSAYPNPFNPVVNFDLELDGSKYVEAKVYNLSGQQIAILHEGVMSGSNKINWRADNQASGIYFIQVSIDGQIITNNKIILLK